MLPSYNETNFQGKDFSRNSVFIESEKSELMSLPSELYPCRSYHKAKGQKNCHVYLSPDKHYYSIPYKYVGLELRLVYDKKTVEIYDVSHQRLAVHHRKFKPYGYTTIREHLPSQHQFVLDWSPEKFISWAERIGSPVSELIKTILQSKAHPEQAYKSCVGILSFAKKVGNERLNNACRRAIHYQAYNYGIVRKILERGLDKLPLDAPPQSRIPNHENQRGNDYYQ